MKAMILAAGRGERMRPLTDTLPKPLLSAGGKPLIVWHLLKLAQAGITEIVINHAWLGAKIEAALGDGYAFGVQLKYSPEVTALETAGGIATALDLLGTDPFLVINGDIWCDWNLLQAADIANQLTQHNALAWLLMVPNPLHNPSGDFALNNSGLLSQSETQPGKLTFSGVGIYRPALFANTPKGQPARLAPLLRSAMDRQLVLGERFEGNWMDIGTPERLRELDECLRNRITAGLEQPGLPHGNANSL